MSVVAGGSAAIGVSIFRSRPAISLDVINAWPEHVPRMRKTSAATAFVWALLPLIALAQDAKSTIEDATKAIGAVGLTSITYSGAAAILGMPVC